MFNIKGSKKTRFCETIKFLPGLELCPSSIPLSGHNYLKRQQLWLRRPCEMEDHVLPLLR